MNKTKNIIFWGSLHTINILIKPIFHELEKQNYCPILLTDKKLFNLSKKDSYLDEYRIEEIKTSSLNKIAEVIKKIDPVAIIISNNKSLSNLIILRLAYILSIRSIYMQHGIFSSRVVFLKPDSYFKSIRKFLRLLYIYFQFCNYGEYTIYRLSKALYLIYKKKQLYTQYNLLNNALVFSMHDLKHVNEEMGIKKENIFITGYPGSNREYKTESSKKNIVLLFQQTLGRFKGIYSYDEEIELYAKINEYCNKLNKKLIIKLHPNEKLENFSSHHLFNKLCFYDDMDNFDAIFSKTEIVLSRYSTALNMAVLNKKPIILLPLGEKSKTKIDYLHFSKVGVIAECVIMVNQILMNESLMYSKIGDYSNFIEEYIGDSYNLPSILINIIESDSRITI